MVVAFRDGVDVAKNARCEIVMSIWGSEHIDYQKLWNSICQRYSKSRVDTVCSSCSVLCVFWRNGSDDLAAVSWCIASMPAVCMRQHRSAFLWCCLTMSHIAIPQSTVETWCTARRVRCCKERGACVIWSMPCRRCRRHIMQVLLRQW